MTESPGGQGRASATPGAALAAARAAAGLAPADVAAQLHISLHQLEAIESDRYGDLPGAVFVRGFVRNYARLLNLDPLPLLHALEPALGGEAPLRAYHVAGVLPAHTQRNHARAWLGVFLVLVLAVLGAATYEWWRSRAVDPSSANMRGSSAPAGAPPTVAGDSTRIPAPLPPAAQAAAPSTEPPAPASVPAGADAPGAMFAPSVSESAATPRGRLELSFIGESWVEVRDATGNVIFSAVGAANTVRTVEGAPPLAVVIGNASGVRITYNRRPVDVAANASRNVARLTLE